MPFLLYLCSCLTMKFIRCTHIHILYTVCIQTKMNLKSRGVVYILNCEICTLLHDDILLEDIAKARIMKKHLDVLHKKLPLQTKNCKPCQELLLMINGQIADVRLDEIMEHIKVLHEQVITFNNVS